MSLSICLPGSESEQRTCLNSFKLDSNICQCFCHGDVPALCFMLSLTLSSYVMRARPNGASLFHAARLDRFLHWAFEQNNPGVTMMGYFIKNSTGNHHTNLATEIA